MSLKRKNTGPTESDVVNRYGGWCCQAVMVNINDLCDLCGRLMFALETCWCCRTYGWHFWLMLVSAGFSRVYGPTCSWITESCGRTPTALKEREGPYGNLMFEVVYWILFFKKSTQTWYLMLRVLDMKEATIKSICTGGKPCFKQKNINVKPSYLSFSWCIAWE